MACPEFLDSTEIRANLRKVQLLFFIFVGSYRDY